MIREETQDFAEPLNSSGVLSSSSRRSSAANACAKCTAILEEVDNLYSALQGLRFRLEVLEFQMKNITK